MYKQKSEIIEQIQSYHRQVAELYYGIYNKTKEADLKLLVWDLYKYEKSREQNLSKHKEVSKAMDCWLDFPCDKLSDQISDCFKDIQIGSEMTAGAILKIEMYFDDCLIKLYNILASEDKLSETLTNVFYYMGKKTKKEKNMHSAI